MKYSYYTIACILLFSACSTIKKLQTVDTVIPCIGAVGALDGGMFSKEFRKVGEPKILEPITVSLQSKAFSNSSYNSYKKYRENLGKKVSVNYHDSLELVPRFYQLSITDLIGVKELLNHENNTGLLSYLEDDQSLKMLTGISFVAQSNQRQLLDEARHVTLIQNNGHLTLTVQNTMGSTEISMKSLEVFDFETSGFCWQQNKRNQPEIAVLVKGGDGCPKGTEKSADKLDETREYLKL